MSDLNLLQLVTEIATRLNRDDLDSVIRSHIADRINYYAKEFFYSAEVVDESITTVAGTRYYPLPVRWAQVNSVAVRNGTWIPMTKLTNEQIDDEDVQINALQSLPSDWCLFGGQLRIWPCGGNYNLSLTMDRSPAAPVSDADVTFWSTDAQTLIISSCSESVCNHYLNDPVRADKYKISRKDEEASLNSKSIRAMGGVSFKPWL